MESITEEKPKRRVKKEPDATADYRVVPLGALRENSRNPRKTFDAIEELAASIAQMGQIVPGLARPHPTEPGAFELVAGHRRFRACERAGLPAFRVVIREMDDATALKVMLVENGQRADVPPLEEAESYRQLRDEHAIGVPQIAADVGRSEAHVYQRLKLTELIPGVQDLLRAGNLQIRSALLFARLDEKGQADALKTIHSRQGHLIADGAVLSHREVDLLVLLNTHRLAHARWALVDKDVAPSAGACLDCHKRTHAQARLFNIGDTDAHDACLDAACWEDKVAAHANRTLDTALETGHELIDPKDATQLWGPGGALADGWIDVEHHLGWALRRQHHATEHERERALFEVFPERAAYASALAQWNQRAGAYLEEHQADSLPDEFPPEPEVPEKTWSDVLGREHPSIKVALDRDGHARRLVTQADLAAALWDLGFNRVQGVAPAAGVAAPGLSWRHPCRVRARRVHARAGASRSACRRGRRRT